MPEPVVLEGPEAAKVWTGFFEKLAPLGKGAADISRSGRVACVMIETESGRMPQVMALDQGVCQRLIREFTKTGDLVSSNFLKSERPGRVLAFYQGGSFLLNLDLNGDPTKRESYSIEPGSLDAYRTRQEDMHHAHERGMAREQSLGEALELLKKGQNRGAAADKKIDTMMQAIAINEVDKIENYIGSTKTGFDVLFHQWASTSNVFDKDGLSLEGRRTAAEDFKQRIYGEFVHRALDQWITDGEKTHARNTSPAEGLASLMSARMFQTMDGKLGFPSGRWLYPEDIEKVAKEMILPPASTPHNFEVTMMSLARFAAYVEAENGDDMLAWLPDRMKIDLALSMALSLVGFGLHWREMAFARLELGHKLAAALMFTDAPDSVQAPWAAWSLVLPDGLLGEVDVRRVWCLGDQPAVLLMMVKGSMRPFVLDLLDNFVDSEGTIEARSKQLEEDIGPGGQEKFLRSLPLIRNLVRGACLALSDPSDWRKGDWYGKPSGSEIKKASKHKELPVGEKYVLGQPVQIDLREEVLDHVRTGKVGGSSPTKLFLVRGHHRRQAHGPGHQLRKTIWIEPFWKGPEDARVLLRPYQT